MAVGPTLGTGLFIGAGQALAIGGPGSLLISYTFLSLLTYFMATALAEVAAHSPSKHGAMVISGFRYMSNSMGFASASLRWYTLAMFMSYEMSGTMVNLGLWNPDRQTVILIGVLAAVIVGSNVLPDQQFKTTERLFNRIKLGTLVCFLAFSLSVAIGGPTGHDHWGFRFWKHPGAFHEYLAQGSPGKFWGLVQCLLHSSIAFTFTPELIVQQIELAEANYFPETTNRTQLPKSKIPRKVSLDVAQTASLYILNSLAMGVMVPFNEPLLTNAGMGAGLSPFIIGINAMRIRILPVTATIAILISSVASGRSFLRLASHTLCAMAEVQQAPAMFAIRNKWGVPWVSIAFTSTFSIFGFLCAATSSSIATTYYMLFVNSSGYLSWLLSCGTYWQFRRRLKVQGVTNTYRSSVQPFAVYFGFASSTVLLLANGLVGVSPGHHNGSRRFRMIMAYISTPIFCAFYLIHRFLNIVPSQANSLESSVTDTPKASSGRCQVRAPPPVASQTAHGRNLQPSSVIELDQVWVMAEEV